MTTIDEHEELNAARTPVVEQSVERCARCASRIEHIVDQDDVLVLDVELHLLGAYFGPMPDSGKVVPIERDVERADGDGSLFNPTQDLSQALSQRHAAALDADQTEIVGAVVLLDDLMRK